MMFKVELSKRFKKQLRKLPRQIQKKVMKEIELLKSNPEFGEKLKGILSDIRRIRVHNYRVAYKVHSSNETIDVFFVDHRKRVYQELERLRRQEYI